MGMGRPWNPPGRCQRRRRRDVDGGASRTTRRASLATVRSLLACHRSWRGRAVLQGPRRRRSNPAGVRMQKCDPPGRGEGGLTALLQWLFFQVGHIGPMLGQLWYFKVFAPEKIPLAIERYEREAVRLFGVVNDRLRDRDYLIGDYGIADIANWPWIDAFPQLGLTLDGHPNLKRWHLEIAKRPAVIRGLAVPNLTVLQTK